MPVETNGTFRASVGVPRDKEETMRYMEGHGGRLAVMVALMAALTFTGVASGSQGPAPERAGAAPGQELPDCPNMPTEPITLTYWEAANECLSEEGVAALDAGFMERYPN